MAGVTVQTPVPISLIAGRYLIFDVNIVTHARREHHICGVLGGTLPQVQQQNVFLGIPLQLMPEEACLLVEQGYAYIVDDVAAHKDGMNRLHASERIAFLKALQKEGLQAARSVLQQSTKRKEKALSALGKSHLNSQSASSPLSEVRSDAVADDESLFSASHSHASVQPRSRFFITPTTSHPPLPARPVDQHVSLPAVSRSYPLFAHLHSKGYYLSPGLRFGCQYVVYPGDPLRFHSHFLAVGADWDEEFDLLDLVGGGRLGTGVKKGFLVGGKVTDGNEGDEMEDGVADGGVRTFCLEWAGM